MKCHVLWNHAEFSWTFCQREIAKPLETDGDTFLISYTINPQRKPREERLEEAKFSPSFWHMVRLCLFQKFLLIKEKGLYFWHSLDIIISMFRIFLLSIWEDACDTQSFELPWDLEIKSRVHIRHFEFELKSEH